MIGQTFSHYKILEKVGEGGMGVVYEAEDTHLHRRVAIKFLASSTNQHHRSRFLREARSVSALTHGHIAAIYDYGETDGGQPFIVMELVSGQTLSELISESALTLSRAVEIVEEVAEALTEAHRLGIVHRDIKPSNVILDGRGKAKVLDFGLAKQLSESQDGRAANLEAPTLFTATRTQSGVVVGTPLYLSPEQATGAQVDTRSDIFALGALLYECVAGRPAFSGASVIEIGAQVIHINPPPPSKFNPRVPKELDRITLKALAKKPEARYQTAAEMLADLRRARTTLDHHLQHHTQRLAATSSGAGFRTSALTTIAETLRRPRLSLVSFLVALAVAALFLWGIVWLRRPAAHVATAEAQRWYDKGVEAMRDGSYHQASKALEQAVTADDQFALAHARLAEAWMELDYADRAKDELLRVSALVPDRSVLSRTDALYLNGITSTVTRDYNQAIESYGEIARLAPEKPQVYVDLGRAYEKNEDTRKAIDSYINATNRDAQYATAYLRVGYLYGKQQELASAMASLNKAETLYQAFGNIEGQTEVFFQRGFLSINTGKYNDARQQLQRALDLARTTGNVYQQVKILLQFTNVASNTGDIEQARQYAHDGIELAQANGIDFLTERGLVDLGNTYVSTSKYDEAEKYFKQSLELAQRHKGTRNMARALLSLGSLRTSQNKPDEAIGFLEQALPFYRQGGYHKETSITLNLLARVNRLKGNYDAALDVYRQLLQDAEKVGDQPQIAITQQGIGLTLMRQERFTEALAHFNECYAIYKSLGIKKGIWENLSNRADALWQIGRYDDARALLDQAAETAEPRDGSDYKQPGWVVMTEGRVALSQRRIPEAQILSRKAFALVSEKYKDIAIQAKFTLGLAEALSGTSKEGRASCDEAVTMAQQSVNDPWLLSHSLLALAEAALESGDTAVAESNALRAQEIFAHLGATASEWRAWLIAALASQRTGNHEAARERFTKAADLLSQLPQRWGAEAFSTYLARPDITLYQKQLKEALAEK
ncbi:MAG: tetratricopeptide repeat protein [Pyrinomonadaceae bacterium]